MTDDDVLNLLEPGCEYTREQVAEMANAATSNDKIFVSQALGRLKRWGKVDKSTSGKWYLVQSTVSGESLNDNAPKEKTPAPSLYDALLKVQSKINGPGVDELDDKIYALQFLGKLLDPSIDKLFQSIVGDLQRLQGK